MFCAMDELMKLLVSGWLDARSLGVAEPIQLLFSCNFSLRSQISDFKLKISDFKRPA